MTNTKVFVNFTIDPTQKKELAARCKSKQVPISTIIRLLVEGYLDGSIVLPPITKSL